MNPTAKLPPKKLRLVLLGLLAMVTLIFLLTAVVGLNTMSTKSLQLVDAKLKQKRADAQLSSLAHAKKQVEQYTYFNDVAKSVIPNDKNQAQAVLDIFQLAEQSGIALSSISFPTSLSPSAISQAQPVEGIKGLYSLELAISPMTGETVSASKVATYPKFLDFLSRIERNRRTAQITQINIQPQPTLDNERAISFELTINIFMRPQK